MTHARQLWPLLLALALLLPPQAAAITSRAKSAPVPQAASKSKPAKLRKSKTAPLPLSAAVTRQLDSIPARQIWKYIVIHHSGTSSGTPKALDRYHRRQGMENGLAYHFLIGNGHGMKDGEVFIGNRWKRQLQGGHLASEELNQVSIGICLMGNFDAAKPTPAQLASLQALLQKLLDLIGLPPSAVTTHRLIHPKHTDCPGKHFPFKNLLLTRR